MYQLLFIIHGMGAGARAANDPPWLDDVLASFRKSAKPFQLDKRLVTSAPKAGDVLVVPLTYHDKFDEIRAQWTQQSGSSTGWVPLAQQLAGFDAATLAKMPGWAITAGEFFWTHVLDVLLYRFINEFRTPVRNTVGQQIATTWSKADADNGASTSVHFISHSLGTSVLHDSLASLATNPAFGAGVRPIKSVMACANVSRVLETDFPVYASANRPSNAPPAPGGSLDAFAWFRHALDPIPAVKPFDANTNGWPTSSAIGKTVTEVKDWNVHGYTHYIDNPAAYLWLFQRLWPTDPWTARTPAAKQQYQNEPGNPCAAGIALAQPKLKALVNGPMPDTPRDFIDVVVRTIAIFREAKAACP